MSRLPMAERATSMVTAAAAVLGLAACGSSGDTAAVPPVPSATRTTLQVKDSSRLHQALTSPKAAVVAAALTPELKAAFLKKPRQLLPAGSKLEILNAQMVVSGETATVPARVTDGAAAGSYLLVLKMQGGQWLLVGTENR